MKKLGCDYQRILIIGSGGSGKSTLTEKLSPLTNLPAVHLDALYWRENWQHVETEEFDRLLEAQLSKEKWILDGNFNRTLEMRLKSADFVIYLDFPAPICVWGVIKRVLRYHGNTRPDMGKGCPEKFDLTFLKWVAGFRKKYREKYLALLSESGKDYIVLKSRRELGRFLKDYL